MTRDRRGMTLVELLAVLVIMGLVSGIAVLAVRRIDAPDPLDPYTRVATARRDALADGVARAFVIPIGGHPVAVAVLPDGRVITDGGLAIDQLTGVRTNAGK